MGHNVGYEEQMWEFLKDNPSVITALATLLFGTGAIGFCWKLFNKAETNLKAKYEAELAGLKAKYEAELAGHNIIVEQLKDEIERTSVAKAAEINRNFKEYARQLEELLDSEKETKEKKIEELEIQLAQMTEAIENARTAEIQTQEHMQRFAHQLAAPLFALRTHTDNLLEGRIGVDRTRRALQSINSQARIVARTAVNFSFVSLILAGRMDTLRTQIHLTEIPLGSVLVDLAKDYQLMALAKEINIHIDKESLPTVRIDEKTFLQAVANIIDNAVKYSEPYGDIKIWGAREGKSILINFESESIRLSEEDAEKIFERGYRTREATLRSPIGTGLGLWLGRHILRLHSGKLWARSTDPAGKTRFIIQLPLP